MIATRYPVALLAAALTLACAAKAAAPAGLLYAPPAAWVAPVPAASPGATPPDAPARFIYADTQTRLVNGESTSFTAFRLKILRPEALAAGNVSLQWNPANGTAIVHWLRIIRGGKPSDVLATTQFQVIQREDQLEQAMLSGTLTATLQVPGLAIGDELEFAATVSARDPTIGDKTYGIAQLPVLATPGSFRYRLSWPEATPLQWKASTDLPATAPTRKAGHNELLVLLQDPPSAPLIEGAPLRFNIRRRIEFSEFAAWQDVSRQFSALYANAAQTAPQSPLRAEAAKIAAASTDPKVRLEMALRLVQDQIRYVYIGFEGGNYRPATADETWQRRFGDCKAKSVVLLTLLDLLGIKAEAVLVDLDGGDGTSDRLPSPAAFNHVLVRADIGGDRFWIDGTRQGDRKLGNLPPPQFRWALPLQATGAALEAVPAVAPRWPDLVEVRDIDASAGTDKPARIKKMQILRGNAATGLRTYLAALPPADAERELSTLWRKESAKLAVDKVGWRTDETTGALVLSVEGQEPQDWSSDGSNDPSLDIPGAGFSPPAERQRPADQDQTIPWINDFPRFRCYATTIRLPPAADGSAWAYRSAPVDRHLDGDAFWRRAGLTGQTMRTVMSRRAEVPEISAADAARLTEELKTFDRNISRVFAVSADAPGRAGQSRTAPFDDDTDWAANDAPCSAAVKPGPSAPVRSKRNFIGSEDYPLESRRRAEYGVVRVSIEVGTDGRPKQCRIAKSSGVPRLDKASCATIMGRFSWQPAIGPDGKPATAVVDQPIRWAVPEGEPRPLLYDVKLTGDRPLDDRHLCSFSDDYSQILAKSDPCVRPLPKMASSPDGQTIIEAQEAAIAEGGAAARFELAHQLVKYQYSQAESQFQQASAAGFAPAALELCGIEGRRAIATQTGFDKAIAQCLAAAEKGVFPALELAPEIVFAGRQQQGVDITASRLEKLATTPLVHGLLASLWDEAGKPEKALPHAYVAARHGVDEAWAPLHRIFATKDGPLHDPKAAYVWGRVAGLPVDAIAATLSPADRAAAMLTATACENDVRSCSAGETPALAAEMAKARRQLVLRQAERLDAAPGRVLNIPDGAGILLTYHINVDGRVDDCAVMTSSGDYARDRAACAFLKENALYRPAVIAGNPTAIWAYASAGAETP